MRRDRGTLRQAGCELAVLDRAVIVAGIGSLTRYLARRTGFVTH